MFTILVNSSPVTNNLTRNTAKLSGVVICPNNLLPYVLFVLLVVSFKLKGLTLFFQPLESLIRSKILFLKLIRSEFSSFSVRNFQANFYPHLFSFKLRNNLFLEYYQAWQADNLFSTRIFNLWVNFYLVMLPFGCCVTHLLQTERTGSSLVTRWPQSSIPSVQMGSSSLPGSFFRSSENRSINFMMNCRK